jgi:hypothetical protein
MKRLLVGLGLAALLLAVPASAQISTMQYRIPFAFVAGNEVLPAGTYQVTLDTNFYLCRFQSADEVTTHTIRVIPGTTDRPWEQTKTGALKFLRYGGRLYLSGVWNRGAVAGHETVVARRVIELAKTGAPPETVSIDAGLK